MILQKNIAKNISKLTSTNKKVFSKTNHTLLSLFKKKKTKNYYFVSFQNNILNFLSFNICFLHFKAKFLGKSLAYNIKLALFFEFNKDLIRLLKVIKY